MKVVHISTYITGGAGSAAYRLHTALLKSGIDSSFLTLQKIPNGDTTSFQFINPKKSIIKRGINKMTNILFGDRAFSQREKNIRKFKTIYPSLNCGFASLPYSNYHIQNHPAVKAADIIHLHWIAGMVDYPSFFKKNKKPLVWTMHDMNPFKGLYHYDDDEKRNESITAEFNRTVAEIKRSAIRERRSSLSYVAPSQWLFEKIKQSGVFDDAGGTSIPNPLDTNVFIPVNREEAKLKLQIPEENNVLLFIAEAVKDHRKGFDTLLNALNKLHDQSLTLLVIGKCEALHIKSADIRLAGNVSNVENLREYYSVADAVIIPSLEDNLPNVMTEAMACGTPVLSFRLGGMAHIIKDNFNGLTAENISEEDLENLILQFIKTKDAYNRKAIREFAVENFSESINAEKYKKVYNSLPGKSHL